ncbi:MAG TPA: hypothetical protein VM580_23640 [Labilithrix sp.]|nr:hypothetical protein [Labilithrix sp.]
MRPFPFLLLFVSGCGHTQINRDADRQIDEAYARVQSQFAYASCQGSAFGPGCGLIMRHAMTEDFRVKFRDHACRAKTTEQCEAALQRMIDAELARRYVAADWQAVAQECDLSPPKCDDPAVYEQLLVNSHNRAIQAKFDGDEARINAERRRRHEEANARAARTLGEISYLLHDGPKCRSYPSAFGGVTNTICTQ